MASKPKIKKFKTTSDDGDTVSYVVIPWPADDGFTLGRRLTPILAQGVKAFKGLKGSDGLPEIKGEGIDVDLEALFMGITGDIADSVSEAIEGIAKAVMIEGDADLIKAILVNTNRTCDGETLKVGKSHDFNQAYTANYGELAVAVVQTMKANIAGIFKRFSSKKN